MYRIFEELSRRGFVARLGSLGMGLGFLVICLSILMFLGLFSGIAICGPLSGLFISTK